MSKPTAARHIWEDIVYGDKYDAKDIGLTENKKAYSIAMFKEGSRLSNPIYPQKICMHIHLQYVQNQGPQVET